jgi:hypothetical protein
VNCGKVVSVGRVVLRSRDERSRRRRLRGEGDEVG